jgi:hypothetical protein
MKTYSLDQLQGTYRGFGPTDESPIAMGELEVTITKETLKMRHATGLKIDGGEIPISIFKPMTKEEISTIYAEGSEYIEKSIGFTARGLNYIFLPNAKDETEFGLLIRGNEMADMLGPTILYNPAQITNGAYEKAVKSLEDNAGKNCFPTLANGGKLAE